MQALDLSNNRLCYEQLDGIMELVQALPQSNLAHLAIAQNRLCVCTEDGIYGKYNPVVLHRVCNMLEAEKTQLEHVDLSGNNMSVEDAERCMSLRNGPCTISERFLIPDEQRLYEEWVK